MMEITVTFLTFAGVLCVRCMPLSCMHLLCYVRFSADQADGWRDNGPHFERQYSDYGPPRREGWGGAPRYERRGSYEPTRRGSRDARYEDQEDWSKPLPRNERVERCGVDGVHVCCESSRRLKVEAICKLLL